VERKLKVFSSEKKVRVRAKRTQEDGGGLGIPHSPMKAGEECNLRSKNDQFEAESHNVAREGLRLYHLEKTPGRYGDARKKKQCRLEKVIRINGKRKGGRLLRRGGTQGGELAKEGNFGACGAEVPLKRERVCKCVPSLAAGNPHQKRIWEGRSAGKAKVPS